VRIAGVAAILVLVLAPAAAAPSDSEVVLTRYAAALEAYVPPKVAIYSYTVSQAVPTDIEQRHLVYRAGNRVRDEISPLNQAAMTPSSVVIEQRSDPYSIVLTAPRRSAYELLFVQTSEIAGHTVYVYDAVPNVKSSGFAVTQVAIDTTHYLPRSIRFTSSNGVTSAHGELQYGPDGTHWVPTAATVTSVIGGKPARERIAWSAFRFPPSLPDSTFRSPRE
jgi:hypothetical protein